MVRRAGSIASSSATTSDANPEAAPSALLLLVELALSGGEEEGECQRPGELRYRGALLCEAHATLLKLLDRAKAVLGSVFRMDAWMERNASRNGSASADEEFVGRIQHERDEAVAALRPMRGQIRSARKALE